MKAQTKRLITAALITPWIVVPVATLYSLWYCASWLGKPLPDPAVTMLWPHPFKPWESIALLSLYGVPTAYASLILIGLPCYFAARKLDFVSFTVAVPAAVLSCIPAAVIFGGRYHFWAMFGLLLLFAVPMAIVFTWMIKEKKEQISSPKPLSSE